MTTPIFTCGCDGRCTACRQCHEEPEAGEGRSSRNCGSSVGHSARSVLAAPASITSPSGIAAPAAISAPTGHSYPAERFQGCRVQQPQVTEPQIANNSVSITNSGLWVTGSCSIRKPSQGDRGCFIPRRRNGCNSARDLAYGSVILKSNLRMHPRREPLSCSVLTRACTP